MTIKSPTSNVLADFIAEHGTIVLDGAMGTELFAAGLESGGAPELWNLTEPDKIAAVHQAYVDAGSDLFLTNSFGGTAYRLKLHRLDDQVFEINEAAAMIGRRVADAAERTVIVAGSVGPTGELLEPMGSMTPSEATAAFAAQAEGLAAGGADVLWIETMSDLDEVTCAVQGARQVCDLPISVTLSFDTAGRTMMGVTGRQAAETLIPLGIAALGANCGNNITDTEAVIAEIRSVDANIAITSKANAGIPVWKGAELHYSGTPEIMGAHAHRAKALGADLIGGCCGSATAHIACMRAVIDGTIDVPEVEEIAGSVTAATAPGGGRQRRSRRTRS